MSIALMNKMQKRIAVIEIFGAIGGAVKSPEMDRLLNTARDDHRIKAVVLDVDSRAADRRPRTTSTAASNVWPSANL